MSEHKVGGLREHFYCWLAGKLLGRAALLAVKRGDYHEAKHCVAALAVGNSNHRTCMVNHVLDTHGVWIGPVTQ